MMRPVNNELSGLVIGLAIDVHRELGPGQHENAYEEALEHALLARGVRVERQLGLPLVYKGVRLDAGYRLDLLVENLLPVELKSVEALHPIHDAQLLTYLRIGRFSLGLLMNFNVALLKDGIRRNIQTDEWQIPEPSNHPPSEDRDPLTDAIVAVAIEVHRQLGRGLLPNSYEMALCYELSQRNITFVRELKLPLTIGGRTLQTPAEIPLLVANEIPVFSHCVDILQPVHTSLAVSRLRQGGWRRGLIMNFNESLLRNGIQRVSL